MPKQSAPLAPPHADDIVRRYYCVRMPDGAVARVCVTVDPQVLAAFYGRAAYLNRSRRSVECQGGAEVKILSMVAPAEVAP